MLTVTVAAAEQIRNAALQSQAQGLALRVAARQAADGSIEYGMGFDEAHDEDASQDVAGVTLVVASMSRPLLDDTVLDWVELGPGEFRFIFVQPDMLPPAPRNTAAGCGSCSGCASRT